jgi:hypothetical protein
VRLLARSEQGHAGEGIVHLALVADVAAATAMRELIVGRGARSDKRVADLVRGLSRVPGAIAAALSNARALAWSFYEPEDALRLARASASGIHIRCQEAFHEGREMRPRGPRTRRTKGT